MIKHRPTATMQTSTDIYFTVSALSREVKMNDGSVARNAGEPLELCGDGWAFKWASPCRACGKFRFNTPEAASAFAKGNPYGPWDHVIDPTTIKISRHTVVTKHTTDDVTDALTRSDVA
jgi:hypothetical protein